MIGSWYLGIFLFLRREVQKFHSFYEQLIYVWCWNYWAISYVFFKILLKDFDYLVRCWYIFFPQFSYILLLRCCIIQYPQTLLSGEGLTFHSLLKNLYVYNCLEPSCMKSLWFREFTFTSCLQYFFFSPKCIVKENSRNYSFPKRI